MLEEHFKESGSWLFRWRSYIPLVMIIIVFSEINNYKYIFNSHTADRYLEILSLLISFFGLFIRILVVGQTPAGTSGRNVNKQIAESLNTKGLYSIVRNPLYLGNFFIMLGIILFMHNILLTIIYILFFTLYYERIIFAEEQFLKNKFGEIYIQWAKNTPAFFPKFKNYQKSDLEFSFKNILKREYNGFFAIILVMFVFEIIGDLVQIKDINDLSIDLFWQIIFLISLIIWTILKLIKKFTTILDVNGR